LIKFVERGSSAKFGNLIIWSWW